MKLFGNRKNAEFTRRKAKRSRRMPLGIRILLTVLAVFAVLAAGAMAVQYFYVRPVATVQTTTQAGAHAQQTAPIVTKYVTKTDESGAMVELEVEEPASHLDGVYNILLCGTDGDGYRTDTIIVAHLDVNKHTAALLSIPRDTPLDSDGKLVKINSVYGGGKAAGMERLERTLAELLGFELDGYLLVDLNAFKAAVDLIGGVYFDVPQDMYYDDPSQDLHIDLKAGYQLLDGEHAMELVRFRKGYASQDIQRTKVQQAFLLALVEQTLRVENLTKLQGYAEIFTTYALTDMTVGNLLYFAEQLMLCDTENIQTYTAAGEGATINGISYYPLYDGSLWQIVNEAFNPYDGQILSSSIHVITPEIAKTYQNEAGADAAVQTPEDTVQDALTEEPGQTQLPENTEADDVDAEDAENAENADMVVPDTPDMWQTPSDELWETLPETETD